MQRTPFQRRGLNFITVNCQIIYSAENQVLIEFNYSQWAFENVAATRPQGYKTFSCSTQLSTKFFLVINVKMPTIVGILTFTVVGILTFTRRKNSSLCFSKPKKNLDIDILMSN